MRCPKAFPGCWIQVPLGFVPTVYQKAKFSWATGPFHPCFCERKFLQELLHTLTSTSIDEEPEFLGAFLRKLRLFLSLTHLPTQPGDHQSSGGLSFQINMSN